MNEIIFRSFARIKQFVAMKIRTNELLNSSYEIIIFFTVWATVDF